MALEFRLLGPLEVSDGASPLPLGARKQRALLARLLLDANRTVGVERLVEDLWGQEAPDSAVKMVQIHVSQLRKVLPAALLVTRPPGYAIEVEPDGLDVVRFRRLHEEGRALLAGGDAAGAASRLRAALALWRGPALAEFGEPFAVVEASHLEELRIACVEDRIDADLATGGHHALIGELEGLIGRHPERERLRAQQMVALYRAGRQQEALAAYRRYRRLLVDELGIEPSQRLKELEGRILRQEATLDAEAAAGRPATATAGDVRYAMSGGVSIAYQVVGDGDLDLVLVHGSVCSFHPGWEHGPLARFYRRLAALGRLILFDKRGTGMSDRVSDVAPLEDRIDDMRAVMDEVGSERAVLLGISEGGSMAALFAATHPDRTRALVALGTFARRTPTDDYPVDVPRPLVTADGWGMPVARRWLAERAPSVANDEAVVRWYASYLVRSASPGAALALRAMNDEIDIRSVLPTIHVPTLVLYREHEHFREATRYMGAAIPGARVVELPGVDHLPWEGDQGALLDEIERFLAAGGPVATEPDRVLATVLCVAGATDEAAARCRALLPRFRGTPIDDGGAGVLAAFDGPARAIGCAAAIVRDSALRAGIHTGECEARPEGLRGAPLELARALADQARGGQVLVSSTVRDLVAGAGLTFAERGTVALQAAGETRDWSLFTLAG